MAIPTIFTNKKEEAIASYDYIDIAEGTGIVQFYGALKGTSGGTSYMLTTEQIYSQDISTLVPSTPQSYNFDLAAFNMPRIIKGTAYVSISLYIDGSGTLVAAAKVQKGSGGTYSDCCDQVTSSSKVDGTPTDSMLLIPLTINETHFKKGDNLRLVITISGDAHAGNEFGHDPMNRDGTNITAAKNLSTQLKLFLPFKIDI